MKRLVESSYILLFATAIALAGSVFAQTPTIEGVYTIDAAASDNIGATINAATANMNFIVRGVARSRLTKTNPAYQRIAIAHEGSEIVVTLDTRKPIRMPDNGSMIKWTREDGEKFDLTAERTDTKLVQTYVAEDGKRINEFSLGDNPSAMTLHVTIISGRLDKPMTYKLAYKRSVETQ